jgi:hypothetical protein
MIPCYGAEPLPPLVHSLKTCKAPERDSQNRHGDHQGSETELRNAHGPISDGFLLILPQRARFAKILGSARKGRSRRYTRASLLKGMRFRWRLWSIRSVRARRGPDDQPSTPPIESAECYRSPGEAASTSQPSIQCTSLNLLGMSISWMQAGRQSPQPTPTSPSFAGWP